MKLDSNQRLTEEHAAELLQCGAGAAELWQFRKTHGSVREAAMRWPEWLLCYGTKRFSEEFLAELIQEVLAFDGAQLSDELFVRLARADPYTAFEHCADRLTDELFEELARADPHAALVHCAARLTDELFELFEELARADPYTAFEHCADRLGEELFEELARADPYAARVHCAARLTGAPRR